LFAALQDAASARRQGPEALAGQLLQQALRQEALRAEAEAAMANLTPRQREVARLAARGHTNLQIAQALVVSPETVKTHMRHVLEKLGLRGKMELQLLPLAPATGETEGFPFEGA
jgi:DNA-binding NarL/FixJ family response regulator